MTLESAEPAYVVPQAQRYQVKAIGILTRHVYPNYGSILQAHSLEMALRRLGVEPKVVDYFRDEDRPMALAASTLKVSHFGTSRLRRISYYLVQTPVFIAMALVFRWYQSRLLTLTETVSTADELTLATEEFDALVAGSDQVWNRIRGIIYGAVVAAHGRTKRFSSDQDEVLEKSLNLSSEQRELLGRKC